MFVQQNDVFTKSYSPSGCFAQILTPFQFFQPMHPISSARNHIFSALPLHLTLSDISALIWTLRYRASLTRAHV